MPFYRGRHVVSASDFDRETLEKLFSLTALFKKSRAHSPETLVREGRPLRFRLLFRGASTRTATSFEDAIEALGGEAKKDPLQFSSIAKDESLWSTARIIGPRVDGIIIRDDDRVGAAKEMADAIEEYRLPPVVINAGDGNREHPTQMLTDLFTIWEHDPLRFEKGELVYALVGDLKDSRTIHSLICGLDHFGGTVFLIGPPEEDIQLSDLFGSILPHRLTIAGVNDFAIAPKIDIWYFTRLQTNFKKPQFTDEQRKEYAHAFGAHESLRSQMKENCIVMHPLPHGPEFPNRIDLKDPRFIHYHQADNGFYVRMALLKMLFEKQ